MPLALQVQRRIFPEFNAKCNYEDSIADNTFLKYYLLYQGDECVGITGFYIAKEDVKSGWLGWFGILPEYRRRHLGSQALEMFFDECRQNGCTHARLYTDMRDNYDAIQFYLANDMVGELYENPADDTHGIKVLIFSKCLTGKADFKLWNNITLNLSRQLDRQ